MKMEPEGEKYNKVLKILKTSKPVLVSQEDVEIEIIRRISKVHKSEVVLADVIDFLFGWVYIGWVRRSLITASVILVMVFFWQQGVILKRIDFLSSQSVVIDQKNISTSGDEIEKVLMMYMNSGRRFPPKTIKVSETQMKELLDSIKELQIKYKDLEDLLKEDPELKEYLDEKLLEYNRTRIKL
jgi:hypothetical protein